jgi:hypothetical protein
MPTVWPFTDPAPLRDVPGSRLGLPSGQNPRSTRYPMSETFTRGYRVIFLFENEKALAQFINSGSSGSAQSEDRHGR